ncbi:tRNA wybutosine-synthesizing protein 3 [Strigomonas culicis]|uniref:tRNA(Phe) 7-[(3-amino-3-carboxypropyl)-4-demethylwyosine(37)-N(4)]-methyltransferase n=1 Tax=Strigomonas culicis TaxID=28005 RepID=S9VDQ9_9TRYP|nr:tRNA wybutosine-synthesizing protein 3 [Strigomonas culicis]|eukprot:EPY25151.1 tRNA wybutosine-synthesizing protein 3 [Strigomonas culicis]
MDVLNGSADYITTSSCSGRIALFHSISETEEGEGEELHRGAAAAAPGNDSITSTSTRGRGMKRGAQEALGWLFVKHGALTGAEMQSIVLALSGPARTPEEAALDDAQVSRWRARQAAVEREGALAQHTADSGVVRVGAFTGEVEGPLADAGAAAEHPRFQPPARGTVCLKMEPFVMHVECRTMAAAKELLTAAATEGGYRNSGVTPPGKKIMCGIRCTTGLGMEVPLVMSGCNYMARASGEAASVTNPNRLYLWHLLDLANEKMLANEKRTDRLEGAVKRRIK